MNLDFWKGKTVFITGHTGFKGVWLSLWLHKLGANVYGYALPQEDENSLYQLIQLENHIHSTMGDIRDLERLKNRLLDVKPEIVFHLAAQSLVRESYRHPVETYSTNVMGTVNVLEAVRKCTTVKAVVNVTTDKCYENKEWIWPYREDDALGGKDPYSNSKSCSELVTSSYVHSFFSPEHFEQHGVSIATARAGNVIGGGDWAKERLVPDCFRSVIEGNRLSIRYPHAIRPWQHVLEPLSGYLMLAESLFKDGVSFNGAWNFGPLENNRSVEWIVGYINQQLNHRLLYDIISDSGLHESTSLMLDWTKAKNLLHWKPRWSIETALKHTVQWYDSYMNGDDLLSICLKQIDMYMDKPLNLEL